ncbi:exopolysaccharide biosynthesis polyprenyl glycosylphosphotransferase [Pontixanthobacter gangjinensis]|uniref:Exopolysaccharide biosynthesis polyprenyl glycosylphosphotransferase n=1 Tax=Pontixanthobacter gangjinensis TaxID=1028742 RepID=A0A6I4SL54_9SPHN|nr:exopolysaccharide biosynthesis polyprenyl glycosylphosphotransferase [Pontixanthobacter gangjinensis]MXO55870.1 exopolysaccharide biosynthesis polyprenyl glycosylphosphotransferase [Pontixanthobacter gangjinensis]
MNAPAKFDDAGSQIASATVPSLERKRVRAYLALTIADVAAIVLAFIIAGMAYRGAAMDRQALLEAWLFLPLYLTIALYNRAYSIRGLTDGAFAAKKVLISVIVAAALLNFLAFYARFNASFSRGTFTIGLTLSALILTSIRLSSARILRRRWGPIAQNLAIIHAGGPSLQIGHARNIDAKKFGLGAYPNDPEMLNRLAQCLRHQEKVLVSCPFDQREDWSEMLRASGKHGEIISDTESETAILGITQYPEQSRAGLVVSTGPLGLRARVFKRMFDITVAAIGLVVTSPILLMAAIMIRLEDRGPVLFIQNRVGRGNHQFSMLKLRTMRDVAQDKSGAVSTSRTDRRITKIGKFLRRTSIDELPQLINVLRGEMSIVGPRPHALGSQAGEKLFWEVERRYWHRHTLKPGLTGLAQVRGQRGTTELESDLSDRLKSDLEYIASWSLWRDFMIVVKTLTVLRSDRAY